MTESHLSIDIHNHECKVAKCIARPGESHALEAMPETRHSVSASHDCSSSVLEGQSQSAFAFYQPLYLS